MKRRENTFCIDFSSIPKKPSYEELHLFISTQLGLKRGEVQRIQCSRSSGCAFVKVSELELAQQIVHEHDSKHEIEVDGQRYALRLRMEDGAVAVKLFDLSEGTTRQQIVEYLSAFGDVLSADPEMWDDRFVFGGIATGVWIIKMMIVRNIPSYITIDGDSTYVSYYGHRHTCKHCGEYVHNNTSCVQNKKLLMQKLSSLLAAKPTYANVTKTRASAFSTAKKQLPKGPTTRDATTNNKQGASHTHDDRNTDVTMEPKIDKVVPVDTELTITDDAMTSNMQTLTVPAAAQTKLFRTPWLPSTSSERGQKSSKGKDEDTDDSTTSTSSRRSHGRPPGKKQKHGNVGVSMVDDVLS